MDQAKTRLPKKKENPKDLQDEWKITGRLSGAIIHGHAVDGHFDFSQWKKGADINCSQITQVLLNLSQQYPGLPIFGDTTDLYIQLDNAPDNKNKTFMAYLAFLVESGLFRKAQINMMKPGNYHFEICGSMFNLNLFETAP